MKQKIKKYITALFLTVALMFPSSCSKDYLDVVDPNVLDEAVFPAKMADFEMLMNDLYGRLRVGFYNSENGYKIPMLMSHDIDCGYTGSNFFEYSLVQLNPDLGTVGTYYVNMYQHIAKLNDFLIKLRDYKGAANEEARIKTMEAEARFLRGFVYFHLLNLYGEDPVHSAADMNKMGVVMWVDEKPTSIVDAHRARSTQGQVWAQIISDAEAAIPPLAAMGNTKINGQIPRIDQWAAKTLLAKSYIFTREFSKAVPVLKDIIDNSGKKLAPFEIYKNMFNGWNKYNVESIFEINAARDRQTNSQESGPVLTWQRFVGPTFVNFQGRDDINGNANFFITDANIPRFGFDDSPWGYKTADIFPRTNNADHRTGVLNPEYKAYSFEVRTNLSKRVDPRLWINTLQPFVDTILIEGQASPRPSGWLLIYKSRQEGLSNEEVIRAWVSRKYNNLETRWQNNNSINHYVYRLADVYLLYAEALIGSGGDQALALEYINKVRRRAYDQPVDTKAATYTYKNGNPITGIGDYTSLTDRTNSLDPTDHLANDPLKYERWAELNQEAWWWYDVRRWDIGKQEVDYYKRVNVNVLYFNRTGYYSLPIPTAEMNSNTLIVQTPPYK